jgi:cytochrome c peroxidase
MQTTLTLCVIGIAVSLVTVLPGHADVTFTPAEQARIALHGPWPATIPGDPGNEYSGLHWAEQAGEQLFNDTALSGSGEFSCASCHNPALGFTDGLRVSIGADTHFRNSQTLLNAGLQRWFGWDGGTDSLWAAALRPMLSPIEMNATIDAVAQYLRSEPRYADVLQRNADDQYITLDSQTNESLSVKAAKLIGAYVRTLVSGRAAFDNFRDELLSTDTSTAKTRANTESGLLNDGSKNRTIMSDAAKRGLKLFIGEANCQLCHYGPNFSNGEFHDIGRPFFIGVGEVDPGRYRGIERLRTDPYNLTGSFNGTNNSAEICKTERVKLTRADWGRWRTPSLRNLTATAPYMHDGSIDTLREVVDAYADIDPTRLHTEGESILRPLDLSEQQREDLVAFLESLSVGE